MKRALAHTLSLLFNPVILLFFLPTFLVYRATGDVYSVYFWTGYTALFVIALAVVMVIAVRERKFTDFDVSKREQRPEFFFLCISIATAYLVGLFFLKAPLTLFLTTFALIIGIFIASLINLTIKVSLHIATLTALIVALIYFYHGWYFLLLPLIPLVSWSRVVIHRHTIQETIVGAVFGTLLSLSISFFIRVLLRIML